MDGSDENMIIYHEELESDDEPHCYLCMEDRMHCLERCTWCTDYVCISCSVITQDGKFCTECNNTCTTQDCQNIEYVKVDGNLVESSVFFACDDCCESFCHDCINELEMEVSPSDVHEDRETIKLFLCHRCTDRKIDVFGKVREFIFKTRIRESNH